MVYRIAAVILGLAMIGLAIHAFNRETFYIKEILAVLVGINFVAYGVGLIGKGKSFRLPWGKKFIKNSDLTQEAPKSVEIIVKIISIIIIIFISLFLVIAVIAFLSML